MATPDTPSSSAHHPDRHRAADQEKVLSALDGLAATSEHVWAIDPASVGGGGPDLFPNIVLSSTVPRTTKWMRDMTEVFEALPSDPELYLLVAFYFSEVQVLRTCG